MAGQISFTVQGSDQWAPSNRTTSLPDRTSKTFLADDLFQLLEPAYRAATESWIDHPTESVGANRSKVGTDLAPHLRRLLPISGGWVYVPRWNKPERLDLLVGVIARGGPTHRPLLSKHADEDDHVDLYLIETTILRRAEEHATFERAEQLLAAALLDAKTQLQTVLKMEQNGIAAFGGIVLEPNVEKKRMRQQADATFQNQIRLMSLRVIWLETWIDVERAKKITRRKRRTTRVAKDNLSRLIKPAELQKALNFFESLEHERRHALLPDHDALQSAGIWYVFMLQQCGVTWRGLRQIRQAHKTIVLKHQDAESHRLRTARKWGDILLHKVSAREDYQSRPSSRSV